MSNPTPPLPATASPFREHPVADPECTAALADAIDYRAEVLDRLLGRHFVSISHLDRETVEQLMCLAASYESGQCPVEPLLAGKVMTCAYLDQPTSRTRLSFESAILHLGGSLMDFGERLEHLEGGRGLLCEVVEMCSSLGDVAVLRTRDADSLASVLGAFRVPVINAGNGIGENPSHSLADLYTLFKWRPDLLEEEPENPIQIGIVGSPGNTRTLRGFLLALSRFPKAVKRVVVFSRQATIFSPGQREELEKAGLPIQMDRELYPDNTLVASAKAELPSLDLLYVHTRGERHLSRQGRIEAFRMLKKDALVLHPETRSDEAAANLDDSPHNGYFAQARGGVFIRIAILAGILGVAPLADQEEVVEQQTGVAEDGG